MFENRHDFLKISRLLIGQSWNVPFTTIILIRIIAILQHRPGEGMPYAVYSPFEEISRAIIQLEERLNPGRIERNGA
jgi:hypothetical protein